jgi:glycosyltransferase involved in cell wall biosynthesis
MGKKLKILFIPRWYPGRVNLLNGIFIKRHALSVATRHKVAVLYVCADPELKDKIYDLQFVEEDGLKTCRVYYNNSLPSIPVLSTAIKFFRYLRASRKGIGMINEKFGKPDICHIHVLSRTFFPAYYYKYFYNTPFLISEQWSGYHKEDGLYKGFFKKMLTGIAVKKASAVTTVSESLKNAMLSHGLKNNYSVIPNVVDTKSFFPSPDRKRKDKFILLHVSNLNDRAKNVSGMVRVAGKLSEKRNDFEFHIAGDGPDRNISEGIAKQMNLLGGPVFFDGIKNPAEVAELMRSADLFLLFSNYDNMPCVMVESLASGLPVIGSAIHGIAEHVKEGRGMLVPPGDEQALMNAIEKALATIDSFDKAALHEYAKKNFSYEGVGERFDSIYQQMIAT